MNRYLGKESKNLEDRQSQSISKRNYSANISYVKKQKLKLGARSARKEGGVTLKKIFHHKEEESENNDSFKHERNEFNKRTIPLCPPNLKNIEKFLFLNQQLKENDSRKKEMFHNRNIASAEPTLAKTNLSKNFQKLFNDIQKNDTKSLAGVSNQILKNEVTSKKEFFNLTKFNYVFDAEQSLKNKSKIRPLKVNQLNKPDQQLLKQNSSIRVPPLISPQQYKVSLKPYNEYYAGLTQNCRETMEDFHLVYDQFNNKMNQALFGIFDGHGGVDIAKKLKDEIGPRFSKLINTANSSSEAAISTEGLIKYLFKKLDEDILKQFTDPNLKYESTNFSSMGSTCTLAFFSKENNNTFLYCANVGDTRGMLISKGGATRITYDHKPTDDFENKRIKGSGGAIFGGRLFGQFSLTRAFGDAAIKKWVICEPFIKKITITDNDRYVVLASDGIWDVITDENCFELSIGKSSAKEYCEELINTAISRWSKDNISCIVIKLN